MKCSRQSFPAWTATRCAAGTTATAGGAGRRCTTPSTSCCCLTSREFKAHWFETGSPKFLIDTLLRRGVPTPDLEGMVGTEALLSAFDVDEMSVEALLFQTGYLTITGEDAQNGLAQYRLGYPNREVRQSLNERLLMALLPDASRRLAQKTSPRRLLAANDFAGLEALLRAVFAGVPHQMACPEQHQGLRGLLRQRGLFVLCGAGLGLGAEESVSGGRADMVVRLDGGVYVFEFKSVGKEPSGRALVQIKERGYADKYRRLGRAGASDRRGVQPGGTATSPAFEVERAA